MHYNNIVADEKQRIMWNSVTVARQTLTLFVGVRIPIPQPSASIKSRLFYYEV